jgi:hypothetical protein
MQIAKRQRKELEELDLGTVWIEILKELSLMDLMEFGVTCRRNFNLTRPWVLSKIHNIIHLSCRVEPRNMYFDVLLKQCTECRAQTGNNQAVIQVRDWWIECSVDVTISSVCSILSEKKFDDLFPDNEDDWHEKIAINIGHLKNCFKSWLGFVDFR